MARMKATTGLSRRVLFLLDGSPMDIGGLLALLGPHHGGISRGSQRGGISYGSIYNVVKRATANGLVAMMKGSTKDYILTTDGDKRVAWLKGQGFNFQNPV